MDSTQMTRGEVTQALRFVQSRSFKEAEEALERGLKAKETTDEEKAVLHSTLGMILRKEGKIEEAAKAYDNAESSLPDDPTLKLINGRFILDETNNLDLVIKKGKEILKIAGAFPTFSHQAYALMGLAWLKKGNRKKALEMLGEAMEKRFAGITSAENIDFHLVEALVREGIEMERCRTYVEAACDLARDRKEYKTMAVFKRLLDSFEVTAA